ncbi:MAG: ribonuclease III [Xanthomonadales bacterium]|jgi:ribonuclease-3|nr:ribonuclease III [Xanthomonadales bacterium]
MKRTERTLPGVEHEFLDPGLLSEALTHRSLSSQNNERLEFLGDAVLNFVIASELFDLRPDDNEGSLSRLRSRVVRGESLARVARRIKLGDHLQMGEGELKSGGYLRDSVLADALEAVLGAVYLDAGYEAAAAVIRHLFGEVVASLPDAETLKDAKTRLQEWLQARSRPLPVYTLVREEGAEHAKRFTVACRLEDTGFEAEAMGTSRRKAEQEAAAAVLAAQTEAAP